MFLRHTPSYPAHQLFLPCLLQTLDISYVRGPRPAWLCLRSLSFLRGAFQGRLVSLKRFLLFCLQELLVVRLEPDDVDFDPLGGVDGLHQQP